MSTLLTIPGIGKTFCEDFARIGLTEVAQLRHKDPQALYDRLVCENERMGHPTSTNYLYVIRMAVYYANGGGDTTKLKWHAWANKKRNR